MIEARTPLVSIPRFAESEKNAERDGRRSVWRTACAYAGPAFKKCRAVRVQTLEGYLTWTDKFVHEKGGSLPSNRRVASFLLRAT